ncbi:hypothetical protein [Nonomuraea zeae]|uniref:Uncharacterized protein n=1 Tax=Nonomuraea zeae TaxID=1642303 RepID=A0A5S4GM96_9ACTN|nr:hypothetical protein [Nonomuraea zeae]TMR34076.1 hypothetical protein ETD85_18090 [Nonomuraea zeae]
MTSPASDEELSARQAALRAEAAEALAELDLAALVAGTGPMLFTGSYVSHLMCWPEVDVMVHAGAGFAPDDVLRLLQRIVEHPGVVGFDYRDERGPRSPTGTTRDERYHVPIAFARNGRDWRIDLTLWLNDPHTNLPAWHETLRDTITAGQRSAVLRIKDVWHRLPGYPDRIGGLQIYTAVIDDGVRTPEQFGTWLVAHGYPES